jgi:hypothetical protein
MLPARSYDPGLFPVDPHSTARANARFCGSQMPTLLPGSALAPHGGLHQHSAAVTAAHSQQFATMCDFFHENGGMEMGRCNGQLRRHGVFENCNSDLNIFVGPSLHNDMLTAMRLWSNLFTEAEITTTVAENSIFSPSLMPFCSIARSLVALSQQALPGLSLSTLKSWTSPPYYSTSNSASALVPDVISASFRASSVLGISSTEFCTSVFRKKRSRELNLALRDDSQGNFEHGDVADGSACETSAKSARIASSLPPGEAPHVINSGGMESCFHTSNGAAPVVDIYVPSMCECGTAIVGVWYRNRPYYTYWFRHPRYAALRHMLEQNRCKNKYRPADGAQASVGLGPPINIYGVRSECTVSPYCFATIAASRHEAASSGSSFASTVISEDNFGALTSPDELLAPKFMSLLCMFQLAKHLDAVGVIYPSTVCVGTAPPDLKLERVKISAHIDCERSKGFVQYRWYAADVNDMIEDLTQCGKHSKAVVGCCCLGHWKRKPPGRDSSKSVNVWFRTVEFGSN